MLMFFIFFFSLLFLNIYKPFNSILWSGKTSNQTLYFFSTLVIVLSGIFVLSVSRILMYFLKNLIRLSYLKYGIWIFLEVAVMAVLYALAAKIWHIDNRDFFDIAPRAATYITLILLLPYIVSWLWMDLQEKNSEIQRMTEMSKYIDEESYLAIQPDKFNLIHFHDDKGTLRLSIKFHNLYYIESSDNYVNIYYENKGKITRFLLRRSLKSIEDNYAEYPLERCHRSFIVNVNKVKVLRKEPSGIFLDLDYLDLPDIPVSKTYSEHVITLFYQ